MQHDDDTARASLAGTGSPGLDDVLGGGLTANRLYLIEGDPGTGKTTLGLQFLLAGVAAGETAVYVSLSETRDELEAVAQSHGWSLAGITVSELAPSEEALTADAENTLFHPSELELGETTRTVLRDVERVKPRRVVIDSLSELRLLAANPLRYRRQILALKQFFVGRRCTVVLLDDRTSTVSDLQLQSIAHGVLSLERRSPEYGVMQRRLQVLKMRGKPFRAGYHDYKIVRGGLRVFPRLIAAEHHDPYPPESMKSGLPGLDELLGGGLDRGTSTLLVGPAGSGKSSLTAQYAAAAAARGERAAFFLFDEGRATFMTRAAALGLDVVAPLASGLMTIDQIDPGAISPGEFVQLVRQAVEEGARVIVIDSLNGYLNATPEARFLAIQLHELLMYLGQRGVLTLLVMAQHGLIGAMDTPADASYLADTIVLLRFFEAQGRVRQAISVLKKRSGNHERTIREIELRTGGIRIGEPLAAFQGVLTGVPRYVGKTLPIDEPLPDVPA
ncbi:MAG: AAA family ATPase [Myxococcales bacterium]|nr:AAA family ATPase [Myxococcales bacterium]